MAPEDPQLVGGHARALGCNGRAHPTAPAANGVELALDHGKAALFFYGGLGAVEVEDHRSFEKQGGFWRVDVFRLTSRVVFRSLSQLACGKGDGLPLVVSDGNHQPPSKSAAQGLGLGRRLAFAHIKEPAFGKGFLGKPPPIEAFDQTRAFSGGVADFEIAGHLKGELPLIHPIGADGLSGIG